MFNFAILFVLQKPLYDNFGPRFFNVLGPWMKLLSREESIGR